MSDCYVYYRIDAAREDEAKRALDAVQAALRMATGVTGRVFCKTHEPLLWMEVYNDIGEAHAADALVAALAGLAETHGLTACLADSQRRHVELFSPLLR